ncbi:hypothetical protein [Sulfoacidibacillus ferrooxidans]|uniref:Uncharacterized protein n=1 Tax=Sulfoacidibacillus ferrooxidans TaxID=2005001 RepID=A0A9X1V6L5_9BACL|nr:hypothetical protein [Sulfoacidibacillus ferrooxidans]MCI0182234.1 hypothetical protein [Sulfoacidibacillus ferrooxidans]
MSKFIFSKRINEHYKVKKDVNGILTLYHSPKYLFYYVTKDDFHHIRLKTYREIASSDQYSDVKTIMESSIVTDYSRDGFEVEQREVFIRDIMRFTIRWFGNAYNWYCNRLSKPIDHICKNRVFVGSMDWKRFKDHYQS